LVLSKGAQLREVFGCAERDSAMGDDFRMDKNLPNVERPSLPTVDGRVGVKQAPGLATTGDCRFVEAGDCDLRTTKSSEDKTALNSGAFKARIQTPSDRVSYPTWAVLLDSLAKSLRPPQVPPPTSNDVRPRHSRSASSPRLHARILSRP
jgi:hypothetical protein